MSRRLDLQLILDVDARGHPVVDDEDEPITQDLWTLVGDKVSCKVCLSNLSFSTYLTWRTLDVFGRYLTQILHYY